MIVGLAALIPLLQSSGATSVAGRVNQLEQDHGDWQTKVRELELQVAQMGSLDRIDHEARTRLKMEDPKDVRYITVSGPPPSQTKLPSRFSPPERRSLSAGSSLWEDLFGWLPVP